MIRNTHDNKTAVIKTGQIKINTKKNFFYLESKEYSIVNNWKKKNFQSIIPIVIINEDFFQGVLTCFKNKEIVCNQFLNPDQKNKAFRKDLKTNIWNPIECKGIGNCELLQNDNSCKCNRTMKFYFHIPELMGNCNNDFFEFNTSCKRSKLNILKLKEDNKEEKNDYPLFLNMHLDFAISGTHNNGKKYFDYPFVRFTKRFPSDLEKRCFDL